MPVDTPLPFEVSEALLRLGENIRLARLRRRMSQDELAQKCHISRKTLYAFENGSAGVSAGTLFSVLWTLGLLSSSAALADPDKDVHGKTLEAARQPKRVRHSTLLDNDF